MELNDERLKIIDSDGNLLIMGGPGSGKTTIALIKANNDCQKLQKYQNFLFLSFARATVTRVMEHCAGLIDERRRDNIKISTYHAFEWEIIKTNSKLLTSFPISILLPHDSSALFPNIDEEDKEEMEEELEHESYRMQRELVDKRPHTLYETVFSQLYTSVNLEDSLKATVLGENGQIDMDKVNSRAKCIYTFYEFLNTCRLATVDDEFIKEEFLG